MLKKILKGILFLLILLMLLIGAAFSSLNWYLEVNKAKIIEQLEALHDGEASFSKVEVEVWQHFPSVSITIDSVYLYDSLFSVHQKPFLEVSKIRADFSVRKLLQDSIEIKGIHLVDGQINVFTDENSYSNLNSIFPPKKSPNGNKEGKRFHLDSPNLEFYLSKIEISFINKPKYKNIEAYANEIQLKLNQHSKKQTADLFVDLQVKTLAFNNRKGGFLENSPVKGQLKVEMEEDLVFIPMTPLRLNEQDFMVGADIVTNKKNTSKLYFKNTATHFDKTLKLLTPAIQEKLVPFQIGGLFSSETIVEGTFGPGEDPTISIKFQLDDNPVKVRDYMFETLSAEGYFRNRIYQDERSLTEGKKNLRISFHNLTAQYGPFRLETPDLFLQSRPEDIRIQSNLKVKGKAPVISDWLKTTQFVFDKGSFELEAKVNGSLKDIDQLVTSSSANLVLQNLEVEYRPGNVILPLDRLVMEKVANETYFKMVSSKFNPIHDLNLEGALKNLPALLKTIADQRASSNVKIDAKKISWVSFLNYFYSDTSNEKTESEKKQSIKKTLLGLQEHFQPQFSLAVDTLSYYDKLLITNFLSGLYFKDEHTLVLEETTFHYDDGLVKLSASIDISNLHQTPFKLNFTTEHLNLQKLLPSLNYFGIQMLANLDSLPTDMNLSLEHQGIIDDSHGLLENFNKGEITFDDGQSGEIKGLIKYEPTAEGLDTKISIEGKPELINEFYKAEDFFFSGGKLKVDFSYQGDLEHVDQLVKEARVNLSIKDSEIYYAPIDVYFPITQLLAEASHGNADFDLTLKSDSLNRKLNLKGKFDHLDAFLVEDVNESFHVNAEAYSPKFYWEDFESLLETRDSNQEKIEDQSAVRESVKALLQTFDPEFKLRFDTFVYSDKLILENLHTGIGLLDSNFLQLEETGFSFHKGTVKLNARFDLGQTNLAPFEMSLATQKLDVGSLMEKLDYLGIKSLQEAQNLTGKLSMQLDLKGIFDGDLQTLVPNATKANLTFDLQEVRIEGFAAIDDFARKFKMKDRFADLRFAPLTNTITFQGNAMNIPLMEIQSNAIQVFIEGIYQLDGNNSNIWVSLPLRNLKKPDLNTIPAKTGYALAGGKIFLEVEADSINETSVKLRLRKKKFYKDRGMAEQFKIDQKRYRQERKAAKKK